MSRLGAGPIAVGASRGLRTAFDRARAAEAVIAHPSPECPGTCGHRRPAAGGPAAVDRSLPRPSTWAGPLIRTSAAHAGDRTSSWCDAPHRVGRLVAGRVDPELVALYRPSPRGMRPPCPSCPAVRALRVWQRGRLRGRSWRAVDYWRGRSPARRRAAPATDRPRPPGGARRRHSSAAISSAAPGRDEVLRTRQAASPYMVLLAAFAALLARLSGEQRHHGGFTHRGPPAPELEGLIGFFVNSSRCALTLTGHACRFRDLLAAGARIRARRLRAPGSARSRRLVEALVPSAASATRRSSRSLRAAIARPRRPRPRRPGGRARGRCRPAAPVRSEPVAEELPDGRLRCDFEYSAAFSTPTRRAVGRAFRTFSPARSPPRTADRSAGAADTASGVGARKPGTGR